MDIREVTPTNRHVYLNLCQSYEGEFSATTAKLPDLDGRFALDTEIGAPIRGFLLYVDGLPVGLQLIAAPDREDRLVALGTALERVVAGG